MMKEIISESESFRILAASEVFEPTREHERWNGSFLSSVLVDRLADPSPQTISDIEAECRRRANQHNQNLPEERVSTPFLYGRRLTKRGVKSVTFSDVDYFSRGLDKSRLLQNLRAADIEIEEM